MMKSLRFQSVLIILLYSSLLLVLLWTAAVPLEQIQQYAAEHAGEIKERSAFHENFVLVETLIWSAIAFTAAIGLVVPAMIFLWVAEPIFSIRNTIGQIRREDLQARVYVHSGKEFIALTNDLNAMLEYQKQEHECMLSAISACRHVIIHEANEKQLIHKICQTLVDIGAYRIAWIGYPENDAEGTVTPAAQAGHQEGNLHATPESWIETACSPAARAIRNRHPAIISDVFGDPQFARLQTEATRHGYASILALPLSANQRILGALTLYAEKSAAFGTEDVRLLTELADDLAYGIHSARYSGNKKTHYQPLS